MKRIVLYASTLIVLGLFLAVLSTSCVPNGPGSPYISTEIPTKAQMTPPTIEEALATWFPATDTPAPPTLMPSFTPEGPERLNFLALGGDFGPGRPKDAVGGAGDKTDVILLVSILRTDPAQITIVQFPRNLYSPLYPDRLLFDVYWQDGFEGIHKYFYNVFGITLQGVAYVNMTNFVKYVDDLGGVKLGREAIGCGQGVELLSGNCKYDGMQLLAWLRDNDNNWGHGVYDAGMRQHRALVAILDRVYREYSTKDFLVAWRFFSKVERDIGALQFVDAAFIGYQIVREGMSIDYDRLAYPTIQRGNVPVRPWRAEVAGDVSLKDWMAAVLSLR